MTPAKKLRKGQDPADGTARRLDFLPDGNSFLKKPAVGLFHNSPRKASACSGKERSIIKLKAKFFKKNLKIKFNHKNVFTYISFMREDVCEGGDET
ncbi:hypothetical protein IM538_17585 [Cytobacillus suaedae]|nr:hypothetical protein IM538_17585 [Cytobacillus suaedae]